MSNASPFTPPRRVPPPNQRALLAVVQRFADYHEIAPGRVQRWISYMVLSGVLSRASTSETGPLFVLKGGVALEMRLSLRARATKDYDTVFRAAREILLGVLDQVFAEAYEGFIFRLSDKPQMLAQAVRLTIAITYRDKPWGTVTMDVSGSEGMTLPHEDIPAISLADFGLIGPASLPCMPLTHQVAQKLHAMTEFFEDGRRNGRYRDLLDLFHRTPCTHQWPSLCSQYSEYGVPLPSLCSQFPNTAFLFPKLRSGFTNSIFPRQNVLSLQTKRIFRNPNVC